MNNYDVAQILYKIMTTGRLVDSGNTRCFELQYFQCTIENPWSLYPARKYDLDYFKREFHWYLRANPYDVRICNFAKMWEKISQPDGRIFSNYGYYWFNYQNGFVYVLRTLKKDPNSRQAYIPMCNADHTFVGNKDVVCTKGIQFRIDGDRLNMHVAMRSSDAIYGLGTDLPCFWTLQQMLACELDIEPGIFVFSADSVHVYEKHWKRAGLIVSDYLANPVSPTPNPPILTSAYDLINLRFETPFGKWLNEVTLDDEPTVKDQ